MPKSLRRTGSRVASRCRSRRRRLPAPAAAATTMKVMLRIREGRSRARRRVTRGRAMTVRSFVLLAGALAMSEDDTNLAKRVIKIKDVVRVQLKV